jgi:hypothetical protein
MFDLNNDGGEHGGSNRYLSTILFFSAASTDKVDMGQAGHSANQNRPRGSGA